MNRPLIVILPLVIFFSLLSCGGNGKAPEPIEPSQDMVQLVSRTVDSWLFLRVGPSEWSALQEGSWSGAESIDDLCRFFSDLDLEFSVVVSQLRETELYKKESPTESQFLFMLKVAISDFEYEE